MLTLNAVQIAEYLIEVGNVVKINNTCAYDIESVDLYKSLELVKNNWFNEQMFNLILNTVFTILLEYG